MIPLDREERGARYLDAMEALHDLVSGRVPDVDIKPMYLAQLLGILNEEARAIVPVERFGPRGFNDNDGDDP